MARVTLFLTSWQSLLIQKQSSLTDLQMVVYMKYI